MLGQRRLLGALVLGTLVASPVLAAITGPAPGTELIPSNTCAGGFDVPAAVDECGDTMTGDLAFQAGRGIAFPAGRLAGDPSTGLNFNGWTVCLANQASPGCGIGDITGVSAGTGLSGGGLNGDVALSVNFGATQARVLGTCGAGNYVRAIAQDGSVTCGADASNTYSGTLPISVSGTAIGLSTTGCGANEGWEFTGTTWSCDPVQQRVTGSCAAGNYVRVINQDGTVTCGADANTLYSAGNGLTLSGTAFSVLGCASGQILKAGTSGTWACASDANSGGTVTSVSTGEGLTGGPVTAAGTLALATPTAGALGGIHATSCEVGSLVSGVDAQGYVVCSPPGAGIGSSVPRANKKATLASSTGTLGAMSTTLGDDGYPITAFYDGAGGDLKVAHCSRSDCGVKTVVTVDGTGDTGKFPGIAIGTDLLPLIAYYDATNGALRVAHCGRADCSAGNTLTTVDDAGDVGQYVGVYIGTDGLPYIAYYDVTNGDLKLAKCSNTPCSASNVTTVDSTGNVGKYASVRNWIDNRPVVAYYDATNGNLKVLKCGSADCKGRATITTVDGTDPTGGPGPDVGQYAQLARDPFGHFAVAYYDATNGDLKLAACTDDACTNSIIIDWDTPGDVGAGISMWSWGMGNDRGDMDPCIFIAAYRDATNDQLKVALAQEMPSSVTVVSAAAVSGSGGGRDPTIAMGAEPHLSFRQAGPAGGGENVGFIWFESPTAVENIYAG